MIWLQTIGKHFNIEEGGDYQGTGGNNKGGANNQASVKTQEQRENLTETTGEVSNKEKQEWMNKW